MRQFGTVVLLIGVWLLAACGGEERDESRINSGLNLIVPTLQSRNLVEECSDSLIENWADLIYPNSQEFIRESDAFATQASDAAADGLETTWTRLILLRDNMTTYTTPTCLQRQHDELLSRFQAMLETFQQFGVGRITVAEFQDDVKDNNSGIEEHLERLNGFMAEIYGSN